MDDKNRLLKIKEEIATLQSSKDRAQGIIDSIKEKIKTKYNVSSIEELIGKKNELEKKRKEIKEKFDSLLEETEKLIEQ